MSSSCSSSADVDALILAGGKATRMGGVAKHLVVVDGRTILERQLAVVQPRVRHVLLSLPAGSTALDERVRVVRDARSDLGPLAGIAAGLAATEAAWLLVVAGDLPYLSAELVQLLLDRRAGEAVGIRVGELPEPLLCALRVAPARTALEALLAAGKQRASALITTLATTWIDEPELRALDPELRALTNVNRLEDLRSSPLRPC